MRYAFLLALIAFPQLAWTDPLPSTVPATVPSPRLDATPAGTGVDLAWEGGSSDEVAWFIEYSLGDEQDFNILTIIPHTPGTMRFTHADVLHDTRINYRLRPATGPASTVVKATTSQPTDQLPGLREEGPLEGVRDALRHDPRPPSEQDSSRRPAVPPAELTATLSSPTSVDLRWKDRSPDESGYVIEASTRPDAGYVVCALLPPDAKNFRKTELPPNTTCFFRVRAFVYGPASAVVSVRRAVLPK